MNTRLVFFLVLGGLLLVASAVTLWYGNIMPNDVSQYSRYNSKYQGQTNLVTMLGLGLVFVGVFVLLYGVVTRSKRKPVPVSLTEHRTLQTSGYTTSACFSVTFVLYSFRLLFQ